MDLKGSYHKIIATLTVIIVSKKPGALPAENAHSERLYNKMSPGKEGCVGWCLQGARFGLPSVLSRRVMEGSLLLQQLVVTAHVTGCLPVKFIRHEAPKVVF